MTPASFTMRRISAASAPVRASGFVQTIAFPAAAAMRTASTCRWLGRAMTTRSTPSSAHSCSIVAYWRSIPYRAPNPAARSELRE
jgi:hypothetical protein